MKLHQIHSPIPNCLTWRSSNNLTVICGREPLGPNGELRWHLSVAHNKRNPTWEEIRDLRYLLVPDDVTMAMFLPPRSQYINLHNFCFHLYELEADAIKAQLILP